MQDLTTGVVFPLTQKENVKASPFAPLSRMVWLRVLGLAVAWIWTEAGPSLR